MSHTLNAGGLISSLPAILGYQVTDSIVAVMCKRQHGHEVIDVVLRVGIDTPAAQLATMPAATGRTAGNTSSAILIAIADPRHGIHVGELLDTLRDALLDSDIPVRARLSVPTTAEPSQWSDIDTGDSGTTTAWTDTAAAAEQVFRGNAVAASRAALVAEFDTDDPAPEVPPTASLDALVSAGEELAALIAGTGEPSTELTARLALAITSHPRLRDAHLLLGLDHPGRSAAVWTTLARHMRGLARAQAATIAAFYHYLGGDGVRTGIALDVATETARAAGHPPLTLTALIDTTLRAGITPDAVRGIVIEALTPGRRT